MTRLFVHGAAAALTVAMLGAAASAQDRCGCQARVSATMRSCGTDTGCQQQVMANYYMCMSACYPQRGDPGIAR